MFHFTSHQRNINEDKIAFLIYQISKDLRTGDAQCASKDKVTQHSHILLLVI